MALSIAVGLVILLVAISPLLFGWIYGVEGHQLIDLANVGQAYGGLAAMISAAALIGIAVSLYLQWRLNRQAQLFSLKAHRLEIVRFAIEHPPLVSMMAGSRYEADMQLIAFGTLLIDQASIYWDLKAISEDALRRDAFRLFSTELMRGYWEDVGPNWAARPTARNRHFQRILTEECIRAEEFARDRDG